MIRPFEIFVAFVSWGIGGKNRPVLVLLFNDNGFMAYPVTTQYENKSEAVRARYFRIDDWSQAGLDKLSYIDTGTLLDLPLSVINNKKPIGRLTDADKKRLLDFLQ
ncbi:MAG: hypothetical protein FWH16_04535 [Oscillospiraceae bacterium]|nr:hypothetical protein [Oscillospiraceae bacterium]